MRNSLKLKKKTKNPFEKFLRLNIHNFLPKFILENFHEIKKISESNIYPRNPKFIYFLSYAYDEVFKFYVANKIEKIPYYVGQHGGNYFTKIHNNYLSELYNSDNFIFGVQKINRQLKKF